MRKFDVCGIGNSILDILVEVSEKELQDLKFEKATMRLVETTEQRALLQALKADGPHLASGGSVANSIIAVAQLGGKSAFIGKLGDDRYGLFYESEFEQLGIDIGNAICVGDTTGTCVVLITPDGERTMRTSLGVAATLTPKHVDEERIAQSKWLFVEGYLFANSEYGQKAALHAISVAKKKGTKVAVTCSEHFIPEAFGDALGIALKDTDLLFANEKEACALAPGATDAASAFKALKGRFPSLVVTSGPNGVFVKHEGFEGHVAGFPCTPKDLTGAGDMLAGAFLYGITRGIPPYDAARAACFLASKVIMRVGARLPQGTKDYWTESFNVG